MTEKDYLMQDLVRMTGLTDRTIRNYIRRGLISGEKIDGVWHFSFQQVIEMMNSPFIKESIKTKIENVVFDFLSDKWKKSPSACVILDYPGVPNEAANQACERICQELNKQNPFEVMLKYSYDIEHNYARFILRGPIDKIQSIAEYVNQQTAILLT